MLLSITYAGAAVGLWAIANGKLGISADLVTKQETVAFGAAADWNAGILNNAAFDTNGLHVAGLPVAPPTPAATVTPPPTQPPTAATPPTPTATAPVATPTPKPTTPATTTPKTTPTPTPTQTTPPKPTTLLSAANSFQVTTKSSFSCHASVPADWTITSNQQSNSADLMNTAHTMYAGYGINAINTGIAPYAGYYSYPLNDPNLYSTDPGTVTKAYAHIVATEILGDSSPVAFTNDYNTQVGIYTLRSIASTNVKGVVFYLTTGYPAGDGYSYIEPMYFAMTKANLWDQYGLLVARITSSISCTTQLVPSKDQGNPLTDASGGGDSCKNSDTGTNAGNSCVSSEDGGYNAQLGTEWVHDSNGDIYDVGQSDWSDDGPDGPGYYRSVGANDVEKLQAGLG